MVRNLDITTLRSFVAVADNGGVTRAAGYLHLTQSAVSMQLKRLEELLGLQLLDRSGRTIALTSAGEQMLAYARRMVALNDEVMARLTDQAFEGEVALGVPHDVVHPVIPRVLKLFNASYPRVRVNLVTTNTRHLKEEFARGGFDVILTTESSAHEGAEVIHEMPLRWIGAPGGTTWRQQPLQLGFSRNCIFRGIAVKALDDAGIPWEMAIDSDSDRTVEATISADLAIGVLLEGTQPDHQELVESNGVLPTLPMQRINLYGGGKGHAPYIEELANLVRQGFNDMRPASLRIAV